jgi:hypothetical protein
LVDAALSLYSLNKMTIEINVSNLEPLNATHLLSSASYDRIQTLKALLNKSEKEVIEIVIKEGYKALIK